MDENDTYWKLRRAHWREACTAYTLARIGTAFVTEEEQIAAGVAAIEKLGWTEEALSEHLLKIERGEINE